MKKITFIFILIYSFSFSQFKEGVYDKEIKTVQLFNPQTNDETAFIRFGSYFFLSFDVLNKGYEKIYYTIKHYDRNWEPSNLFESEYIEGYNTAQIKDYKTSFNTLQYYTHYKLQFPSKEMKPKLSGNYVISVYRKDKTKPIFTKRFSLYEELAGVGMKSIRFSKQSEPLITQRVEVEANLNNIQGSINLRETSLCILQHNNWNTVLCNIAPQFNSNNVLMFNQLTNAFEGGNQFIAFDTKNISIAGMNIDRVEVDNGYNTHLYVILPDKENYNYNPDANGAFYILRYDLGDERNGDYEGDYSRVYFKLLSPKLEEGKEIYVAGSFSDYSVNDDYKMEYNQQGFYEKAIYLKQGYYNFIFTTVNSKNKMSVGEIMGSFWQTKNLYQALIYYKPLGANHDSLIGYGEVRPSSS